MKIIEINEDGIKFDDGTTIIDEHRQDCCEHVYADWKQLKDTGFLGKEIEEIKIEGVEDLGFRINQYFVPCYNEQNGYYGDDLILIIKYPNKTKKTIDITSFVEDKIE